MARPTKTLLARVLEGQFVARKHEALLDDDLLPLKRPDHVPRRAEAAWKAMRHAQRDYQDSDTATDRRAAAREFADSLASFTDARASRFTLGQMLLVTVLGPSIVPKSRDRAPHGIDEAEWTKAARRWPTWERKYGAAWRLRNSLAVDDDLEAEITADPAGEIPEPPGLDLFT